MVEYLGLLEGNRDSKVKQLWTKLKAFYKVMQSPNQIQALTPEMLQKPTNCLLYPSDAADDM
eukprot:11947876-Alexandrium_andersonii.AAC.1